MSELKRHSVLIVDDEEDICTNLADILQEFGYDVDTALSGKEAVRKIAERTYDIALLDLKMPDMDGLAVYRCIQENRAEMISIIISAYATPQTSLEAQQSGVAHVLTKPVDLPELMDLLKSSVQQPVAMVVDDDVELSKSLWDLLRQQGLRVSVTHSQADALQRLAERQYQIVLLEVSLPDGDGRQLLNEIQLRAPGTKAILMGSRVQDLQRLPDVQPDAVCEKPFQIPALLETIRRLTDQRTGN